MKNKRIVNIGIIAAVVLIGFFAFSLLTDDTRGYQDVDTSVALEQLDEDNVEEAFIDDREQRVRLDLKEPTDVEDRDGAEKISAKYPARTAPEIFDAVSKLSLIHI